jgi:flagellar biosynthesis protein FliR
MNVFQVGLPAKILVALLIFGTSLPFVAGYMADSLQDGINGALQSIQEVK